MKKKVKFDLLVCSLVFIFLSLTFVIAGIISSDSSSISEWTSNGRTINNTRYYPGEVPSNITGLPNVNFTFTGSLELETSAIVVGDSVYIAGSYTGYIYRLNISNLSQQLDRSGSSSSASSPVYWNGSIYFGASSSVRQINASNLSQTIATKSGIIGYVYHNPIIYNGYAYFGGFNDGLIYQVNATNITQTQHTYSQGSRCYSGPSAGNGFIYISCGSSTFQLNASDISKLIGRASAGSGASFNYGTTPLVTPDYVYVPTENNSVMQLNASNISINIANFTRGANFDHSLAYHNGYVYAGNNDGNLYQLNASNISQVINELNLSSAISPIPTVTNNYVFATSGPRLFQLSASNITQVIANISFTSGNLNGVTIANGKLYFARSNVYYQFGNESFGDSDVESPNITLNSPEDGYSYSASSSIELTFNCSATDNSALNNLSLYITDSSNSSFALSSSSNVSGLSNSSSWSLSLSNGNYTWGCLSFDTSNNYFFSSNRSILINYVAPETDDSSRGSSSNTALYRPITTPDLYSRSHEIRMKSYTYIPLLVNTTLREVKRHTLYLYQVSDDSVNITVRSDPIKLTIAKNSYEEFNLPNVNETIRITYLSKEGVYANLKVEYIPQASLISDTAYSDENSNQPIDGQSEVESNNYVIWYILLALIVAAISYYFYKKDLMNRRLGLK